MGDVPVYRLECRSEGDARKLAEAVRSQGFFHGQVEGAVLSFPHGGGFERLAEIGDLARYLDYAGDREVSDLYMHYARTHP